MKLYLVSNPAKTIKLVRTRKYISTYVGISQSLPADRGEGWNHVHINCTCENQYWTDRRLPIFLELPIRHKSITHEPMLEAINIRKYLEQYANDRNPDAAAYWTQFPAEGSQGRKPASATMPGS